MKQKKTEEQQEFFKEFKGPKSGIDKIREKYIPPKWPFITISIEKLVFIVIIIIMIIVLFFSLGVERGKRLGNAKIIRPEKNYTKIEKKISKPASLKDNLDNTQAAEAKQEQVIIRDTTRRYTIQVVAYRDKGTAEEKVSSLRKEKSSAFIIPENGLFQVCIGRYETLKEAKVDMKNLQSKYSDCFTRSIKSE